MKSWSRDLSGEKRCTTSIRSGEAFCTVTPTWRTSCGSRGCAMATRFCTCTWAMSRLVPRSKVTAMVKRPSAVEFDDMYSMFSTPLIWSSMGATTVEATTSELAPGYCPCTLMIGGAISGNWATGRRVNDTAPRMTKMIDSTEAKIGRSMKKCEIFMRVSGMPASIAFCLRGSGGRRRRPLLLRRHLAARTRPHHAVDDHAVIGRKPRFDDAQVVGDVAERHVFHRHRIVGADHQHIFACLLGTDRDIRHEQRLIGRGARNANAGEHARREQAGGILEHGTATDRARGAIDHVVDEVHAATMAVVALVDQPQRHL